jgi:hypothetical protein
MHDLCTSPTRNTVSSLLKAVRKANVELRGGKKSPFLGSFFF